MQRWALATNSYYKTVSVYLDEAPWYIFALENVTFKTCSLVPHIKIPFTDMYFIDRDKETYSIYEYYGDLNCLFHSFVCTPITSYCFNKTNTKHIEIAWDKLKELDEELWTKGEQEYIEYMKEDKEDE